MDWASAEARVSTEHAVFLLRCFSFNIIVTTAEAAPSSSSSSILLRLLFSFVPHCCRFAFHWRCCFFPVFFNYLCALKSKNYRGKKKRNWLRCMRLYVCSTFPYEYERVNTKLTKTATTWTFHLWLCRSIFVLEMCFVCKTNIYCESLLRRNFRSICFMQYQKNFIVFPCITQT